MKSWCGERPFAELFYSVLLRAYPRGFRLEYGREIVAAFRAWRAQPSNRGGLRPLRFWTSAIGDIVRSAPREWVAALGERLGTRRPVSDPYPPPYVAASIAGLGVLALYVVTLAPTIAFWDSGEYATAAHILGIPHPPGSPLFVLAARAWETLLAPTGLPPVVRINLFSAALSAAAHAFWFLCVDRALAGWTEDRLVRRVSAFAAVVVSATAFTVWNQSNVTEKVYAISFFTTALVTWLLLRWRDTGRRPRTLVAAVVVVTLSATNHLMGVLVVPAALLFVLSVDHRAALRPRVWVTALPLVVAALSVQLFLPIRAADRPILAEGDPRCETASGGVASVYTWGRTGCDALSAVLTREQYDKPPITQDPTVYPQEQLPRTPSLLASQFKNYLQYFDWQWGRSVAGRDPLFGGARPFITLMFLLLGLVGARMHWRADRRSALYLTILFLTLSIGLVLYLNFKYGYSIARERFPDPARHEVRERDYFFLLGFGVWGLWAGMGLGRLWARASEQLRTVIRQPRLIAAPVLALALIPLMLNWGWATRTDDYTARDWAYNVLMSVGPYGVLFTNGDNDTFPLWYLQEVEGVRQDVTVVVLSYLRTDWYAKQLRQLTAPCPHGVLPAETPTRIVCQRPFEPAELPRALAAAGWGTTSRPPEDSILPFPEERLDQIGASYFVLREPMPFRAGRIQATIASGTPMMPEDTFAAAIVRETIGDRPIHFMPGASVVARLGLLEYTVRQGLVWKLHDGTIPDDAANGIVPFARHLAATTGAAINLPLTDTLAWDVYLRRGRILEPDVPWVDAATRSIPTQYAYTHYSAAQAHAMTGSSTTAARHLRRARWWEEVADL